MQTMHKQPGIPTRSAGSRRLVRQFCALVAMWAGICCLPASAQVPAVTSVVNYATLQPGPVAAGSWAQILGSNLASATAVASSFPLPRTLGNTSVLMDGASVPLMQVNPGAILFQLPWELAGKTTSILTVKNGSATSAPFTVNLATFAPGIFTDTRGAVPPPQNPSNWQVISPSNPAPLGSVVVLYCTGLGPVTNQPATGEPAPTSPPSYVPAQVTAIVGGVVAPVYYAGLTPGFAGLYQMNIGVPQNAPIADAVGLSIKIGGVTSNTAYIATNAAAPLSVQPASLSFEGVPGAGGLRPLTLRIGNTGSANLDWKATVAGANWLTVTPSSGTVVAFGSISVQVAASTSGLAAGTYSASITVQTSDGQQKQSTAVTLLVRNLSQHILLSQAALVFTGVEGGDVVPPDTFGIINLGSGIMTWNVSASSVQGDWLKITPASGSSDAASLVIPTVQVSPSTAGLRAGQYSGLVKVEAPGADNSPLHVQVQFNVLPRGSDPGVQVRPTGLIFTAVSGGALRPRSRSVWRGARLEL